MSNVQSSTGSNATISSSKIDPLASETKKDVPLDESAHGGVVGTDRAIGQTRIEPLGGKGQYQHPLPHANDAGVVGKEADIEKAKVEPLAAGENSGSGSTAGGLTDEGVDAARVQPLGEVREEMS